MPNEKPSCSKTIEEIERHLSTDRNQGLSSEKAGKRLEEHGETT